ncbi:MAG: thiosulfate/3-mercaptopyruvate sulfurtransferase [Hyphomicrobiales bacterium]|jgi:thiosulfate/3-mercaptopyruvate sulfurtransferase|nr:thiosulfate/3-mercaptopyruvate sulfurtransferase [Hyphomicrobiales bacterium]
MTLASALRSLTLVLASLAALMFAAAARADSATPLVSTGWLKEHLKDPDVFVLDVRSAIDGGGVEAYQKGHIPGAIHSDYDKAGWRVTRGGVPFMLPTLAELEKLIGELGIDEDTHVVVVPAGVHVTDFGSAARTYWTLKVAGLSKVSILDGGYAAWAVGQNAIETGPSKPSPKIFTATLNKALLAESGDVQKIEQSGGATLIDSRPASFFAGKQKAPAALAYGHIPGAVNVDSATFYDAKSNRLKPQAELVSIAAALPGGPAVTYCNTGHWAATDWFVLSEILGRSEVRLYYGSMVDWTSDASRPLASARTKWDDLKKTLGFGS